MNYTQQWWSKSVDRYGFRLGDCQHEDTHRQPSKVNTFKVSFSLNPWIYWIVLFWQQCNHRQQKFFFKRLWPTGLSSCWTSHSGTCNLQAHIQLEEVTCIAQHQSKVSAGVIMVFATVMFAHSRYFGSFFKSGRAKGIRFFAFWGFFWTFHLCPKTIISQVMWLTCETSSGQTARERTLSKGGTHVQSLPWEGVCMDMKVEIVNSAERPKRTSDLIDWCVLWVLGPRGASLTASNLFWSEIGRSNG